MGSGAFSVDPAAIDGAAPKFSAAGSDVQAAIGRLESAIAGDRAAIGNDTPGQKFAGEYLPQKAKILAALADLVKGLDSIDPALRSMASNYGGADSTNAGMLGGH
jgi:uncharacterized protein YukE